MMRVVRFSVLQQVHPSFLDIAPNLITLRIRMRTMTSVNDNSHESHEVYATPGLTSSSNSKN